MKNDQTYLFTRIVGFVVAFLSTLAFIILFFLPDRTGELFAWPIKPHMTSLYIGAAYLGGVWSQLNIAFGKRWHRVHVSFPPMMGFATFMLAATLLHWDRFSLGTPIFNIWLVFYVIAPFLLPVIWMYNKRTDSGLPEESDVVVSSTVRLITRLVATVVLVFVASGFLYPDFFTRIWPWTLTPLTARVMAGWLSVIGLGSWMLATESRWSAWRVFLGSIFIGHGLVLVAAAMNLADFTNSVINWFTICIGIMLSAIAIYYVRMESERLKK